MKRRQRQSHSFLRVIQTMICVSLLQQQQQRTFLMMMMRRSSLSSSSSSSCLMGVAAAFTSGNASTRRYGWRDNSKTRSHWTTSTSHAAVNAFVSTTTTTTSSTARFSSSSTASNASNSDVVSSVLDSSNKMKLVLSNTNQNLHSGWRPTIDDVDRISWGKPAKEKGTGSRGVPHRLNSDERLLYDLAKARGFLEVAGSAWRSQRRDAPLCNTYRSYCDAVKSKSSKSKSSAPSQSQPHVYITLSKQSTGMDHVMVDISPLRIPHAFAPIAQECIHTFPGGVVQDNVLEDDEGLDLESKKSDDNDDDDDIKNLDTTNDDDEDDDDYDTNYDTDDDDNDDGDDKHVSKKKEAESPWETRPIYQLPPYMILWQNIPRSEAKTLVKQLAHYFGMGSTSGKSSASSRKPVGIKPGKNRRHGGYGIG